MPTNGGMLTDIYPTVRKMKSLFPLLVYIAGNVANEVKKYTRKLRPGTI
jgi:NADH:ubiquinone oxidoreductase subunit B-like Fe-S oxidoreductase